MPKRKDSPCSQASSPPLAFQSPAAIRRARQAGLRLFSAINVPDAALASRSIVVPLVAAVDREKANSDPLKYERRSAVVSGVSVVPVVSTEGRSERQYQMTADTIAAATKLVAEDIDAEGDWINNRTVGKALSRLRLAIQRLGRRAIRGRVVTHRELQRLAQANGIELPDPLLQTTGTTAEPATQLTQ